MLYHGWMYDPVVWGTAAQWAAGIGSTSAFAATFYVIRRDAKVRRQAQASKVAFYVLLVEPEHPGPQAEMRAVLHVSNHSDAPIYRVHVTKDRNFVDNVMFHEVLKPGDNPRTNPIDATSAYRLFLVFQDNTGRWFRRYPMGGLFDEPKGNGLRARWVAYRASSTMFRSEGLRARLTILRVWALDKVRPKRKIEP